MKIVIFWGLLIMFALPFLSNAACDPNAPPTGGQGGEVEICNPIDAKSPQELIGKIINAVLGISGSLALLMFIYGGFTWMLSGGNSEKVSKGKNTLVWATIGLIVIFSSYAMVNFVFSGLEKV